MRRTARQTRSMEETYLDVEKMLRKIALTFRRHMHDANLNPTRALDEAFSLANQGFMVAYDTFDDDVGVFFSTWCYRKAMRSIQDANRAERESTMIALDLVREPVAPATASFFTDDFLDSLSDRAKYAAEAILFPPSKLEKEAEANGGGAHNYRASLKHHLIETCGWTLRQCKETFQEIAEALKC